MLGNMHCIGLKNLDFETTTFHAGFRFISEKNRAIPNESADPEQYDRDKRIDLQSFVRQLGRDRTGEVAGRENKPEFHRGWHDKQRRECNSHHTEQSKITSDSELRQRKIALLLFS